MGVNELDYKMIGQRIRAERNKKGWQQAELAFRAGMTSAHLSHIETAQTIMIKCELMILRNYQARGMRIIPIEPMITKLQSRLCLRDWGYRIYLAETVNLHQKKKNSGCCSTGYM